MAGGKGGAGGDFSATPIMFPPMTDLRQPTAHRETLRGFLIWLTVVAGIGFLLFLRYYLAELAAGYRVDFKDPLIREMTGALGAGLLFFPLRRLVRSFPLERGAWKLRVLAYWALLPVFSALHTTLNWGFRSALFPLAGLGAYDYGILPLRYAMEFPGDVVVFWVTVAALHGVRRFREARERELRTAQLESSLAQAELRNLRLQLQPHFLFNALNTISATMYDDPAAADEMLDRLAELLRASLKTAQTNEVPLATELETLDSYLAITRARFGDRLRVEIDVDPAAREALVPSMILQPLVENAVRHGNVEKTGHGAIAVRVTRNGDRVLLAVEDDGPGSSAAELDSKGLGLAATAERLELLYGGEAFFEAGNVPGGGFRVAAGMPLRRRGGEGK